MASTASISGVISGLDTSSIITQMMAVAKQPQDNLKTNVTTLQTELSAWQDFNTQLLALQTSATAIGSSYAFNTRTVTSSDQSLITGTATSSAAPGTYYIKVNSTAQSEQISSQGFANTTDPIGQGNVNISFTNGKSFSVTIDDSNNSLAGLADAINKANGGVTAVVVNSGDATTPYKLMLTSNQTGSANAMTVDTSGLSGGTAPVVDQVVQDATDATLQLGTGAGQINITKSSNTINDVIPGVSLNLTGSDKNTTVTLQVQADTSTMAQSIQSFVTQYNSVMDNLNKQFTYSSTSTTIPTLFGNSQLETIQNQIASSINAQVSGLTGSIKGLSDVGIGVNQSGDLTLDTGVLQSALQKDPDSVSKLFSTNFTSSNPSVTYVSNTSDTQPSPSAGYNVSVTQAAAQSSVTAGVAQTTPLAQSEVLIINSATIVLQNGWSQQQVIDQINSRTQDTGVTASATGANGTGAGNYLTLTQVNFGSDSHIQAQSRVSSGAAGSTGLGTTQVTETSAAGESGLGTGVAGQDMVGTINGIAAKSQGQYLIAQPVANGINAANGLELQITATAPFSATVNFTKGIAASVADVLSQATGVNGTVSTAESSINSQVSDLQTEISNWDTRLNNYQDQITTEFNDMENALGQLQSQGQAISALLGSLSSTSSTSSSSNKSSSSSSSSSSSGSSG